MTGVDYVLTELGVTKAGLARLLSISRQQVQQWEYIPRKYAKVLVDVHGLDLYAMTYGVDE